MWKTGTIGDVLSLIQNGVNCHQDKSGKGLKISRIETIADANINYNKTGFSNLDENQKQKAALNKGDILFSHINSPIHVGKTAIYDGGEPLYHGINLLRLNTIEGVDSNYFNFFLQSLFWSGYWRRTAKQSVNQASVNQTDIKKIPFAYPPLSEQERIVAKLDAAFAEIDESVEAAKNNLANINMLVNASLGKIFDNGKDQWDAYTLNDLCIVERGSSPRPIKNFITEEGGVNWVKIGDTSKDGKYVTSTRQRITKEGAEKSRYVNVGDFILTNSMSYGRPYIMAIDGCIHDGWFVLRLNGDIDVEYFFYLLSSPFVQNQFKQLAAGSVVKNISGDLVKKTKIPLPIKERQIEIRKKIVKIEEQTEEGYRLQTLKIENLLALKSSILKQELQSNAAA